MEAVQFVHEALNRFSVLLGNEFWLFFTKPFGDVIAFCERRCECSRCQCGNLFNISMMMALHLSGMGVSEKYNLSLIRRNGLTWPFEFTKVRYSSEKFSSRCRFTSFISMFGAVSGFSLRPMTKANRTMSEYSEKGK